MSDPNMPDPVGLDWAPWQDMRPVPLLVVDLVGTIIRGPDDAGGRWVNGPEDVSVFPNATALMVRWKQAGGRIVLVSNQGGVAFGHMTRDDVIAVMVETDRQTGSIIDEMIWCEHHPDAPDPLLRECWCRKPGTAMPHKALLSLDQTHDDERYPPDEALFVGDRTEDEECARRLGIRFMWAHQWRTGA